MYTIGGNILAKVIGDFFEFITKVIFSPFLVFYIFFNSIRLFILRVNNKIRALIKLKAKNSYNKVTHVCRVDDNTLFIDFDDKKIEIEINHDLTLDADNTNIVVNGPNDNWETIYGILGVIFGVLYYPYLLLDKLFYYPFKWIENMGFKIRDFFYKIHTDSIINIMNIDPTLFNATTLQLRFLVNEKRFQLTLEGNFQEKYKMLSHGQEIATEEELFRMIVSNKRHWFQRK